MATFNGTEGNDTLVGGADNDLINGNGGNDFLQGGGGADTVLGGAGNDTIGGNDGADWLRGGAGNDMLAGGSAQDSFAFTEFGATNADLLTDFDAGWDNIQLEQAVFTTIGAVGRFSAGDVRFFAAAGATSGHDADDRIIYNTTTGQLFYDADGNGAGASQLIATIQNHSALQATDIFVNHDATVTPSPTPTGTINGTSGNDTLTGTDGPDTINGLGGDDSIVGLAGADSMSGGDGNDTLDGWNSRTFDSDVDIDTMAGGLGNDTFLVDNVNDVVVDAGGIDTVLSHDVNWTLAPGFENLTLRQDNDSAIHGTGNDQDNVIQANWFSVLDGRGGNDTILGSVQNDTLLGGDGNDSIVGGGDFDSIDGGAGDDTIDGGDSDITGGTGADHFVLSLSPNGIHDFVGGTDKLRLDGTRFANVGPSGNFTVGDERFYADLGASSAHDASDRVIYNTATGELFYDADGTGTGSSPVQLGIFQGLSVTDLEVVNGTTPSPTPTPSGFPPASINGTSGNDNISGTGGNDTIYGLGGNDTIFANGGNDWVVGGAGNDSLSGGSGQDTYGFGESGAANADTVANFDSDWDAIALDAGGFSNIGATGRFAGGDVRFFAGAGATGGHDADDRIVYNTSTGQLFYDADGSGSGASQLIATFTGNPGIAATDITVFGSASPSPTPTPSNTPTEGDDRIVGTNGNDSLAGLGGNDTLVGLDGNDTLDGGPGIDSMDGGNGDDVYFVDNNSDTTFEAENGGIDEVRSTADFYQLRPWVNNLTMLGTNNAIGQGNDIENLMTGNSGNNQFQGAGGNDTVNGGAGNDTMFGQAGDDVMNGGLGNDYMEGGEGADTDTFVFDAAPGAANADTIGGFVSGREHIVLDGGAFTNIGASGNFATADARFFAGAGATQGHDADDRIIFDTSTGNIYYDADGSGAGASQLFATVIELGFFNPPPPGTVHAGDFVVVNGSTTPTPTPGQAINGTAGNDSLVGTSGHDTISGLDGSDTLQGLAGDDSLLGGTGDDSLVGGDGNDTLIGHDAADSGDFNNTMDGGMGDDVYVVTSAPGQEDHILPDPGGYDTVIAEHGTSQFHLTAGLDRLELNVDAGPDGFGNELDNVILSGFAGGSLFGMGGNDLLVGRGFDAGQGLFGGDGNDTLQGSFKSDLLVGGAGNDIITTDDGADRIRFDVAPGSANADTVTDFTSGSDTLQLDGTVFSSSGFTGRFAAADARFFSSAGANAGHDADDRIVYNTTTGQLWYDADGSGSGAAQLIATLQGAPSVAATDIEVINASGVVINGTEGNDSLVGTDGPDTINGFGGNDTIDGRGGVDSMVGGSGDDLYFVDNSSDVVVEAQNGGIDEVRSTVDYTLSAFVNNLTLLNGAFNGIGNDIENVITGDATANALYGMGGNDTIVAGGGNDDLIGGLGNDSMSGGTGDDIFALNNPQIGDNSTQGSDTVDGGDGFDFVGFSTEGVSSTAAVTVDLSAGTYSVADPAGAVSGVLLNVEWIQGSTHDDLIIGNAAANRLDGFFGNDTLIGGAGNDTLTGGDGSNTLNGGAGLDVLSGGSGSDSFIFDVAPNAATNEDDVHNFTSGADKIHLDARVMTELGASGNLAAGDARFFAAPNATGGHDADDRIVYDTTNGFLFYDPDGSGAQQAQVIANLSSSGSSPAFSPATVVATDIVVDNGTTPTPTPTPGTSINGTNGNDTLVGGAGNDTIFGNSGNDWIEGRGGNDQLSGGSGQDSYVFREFGAANADTLLNFDSNWDAMRFDSSAFTALGGSGHFAAGDARFFAGTGANAGHDADDRIVYNTSTGQLYYDADGAGGADAQLVATVQGAGAVAAPDIWVI